MISLKLNSGEIVSLIPKREDDGVLQLLDEHGVSQLEIREEGNRFVCTDKKNIDVDDTDLSYELDNLYIQLQNEEMVGVEESVDDTCLAPFNPEEISITTKVFTMDTCLRRLIQGSIDLSPDFQRSEVWTKDRKSQLIESLMLKIPIPMFYVSADESSNLTVIDGLQRFSAIRDFVLGREFLKKRDDKLKGEGFKLKNLEFWKDYEGRTFKELPTSIVNRILETEFTFTIINPGTPEEVRRNIFKRINTGGIPLSSQEVRNALYSGRASGLLNELAALDVFKQATDYTIKDVRMADKELILRFVSFVVRKYTTFIKAISVDTWLSDTMIIVNALPELDTRELKRQVNKANATIELTSIVSLSTDSIAELFNLAMLRSYMLFGEHAFRKSYSGKRRAAVNKSLFETWGVLLSELSNPQFDKLYDNSAAMMDAYKELIDSNDFAILISRDSMKPGSIRKRFEIISELIQKHLQ